jgi:hypothetical protein
VSLEKATLQPVESGPSPRPRTVGEPITVQLNPASLRYAMNNNVDMGKAFARPSTQYQGTSSATLTFDLVFDSADEGTSDAPVDVRRRTRRLEQFLLPARDARAAPPRVKFVYGTFEVIGVMSGLNCELDLFAASGVPLRAKLSVTIKEQRPEFDAKLAGAGADAARPAAAAGTGGSAGAARRGDRTAAALAGESVAGFAARMGQDPTSWRQVAAANGVTDPVRMPPGAMLDYASSPGPRPATPAPPSPGSADPVTGVPPADVTAGGGVERVITRAAGARAAAAATGERAAFAGPAGTERAPATDLDGRAGSYGAGVPLRDRLTRVAQTAGVPVSDDPTVPGWRALPPTATVAPASGGGPCRCTSRS